MNEQQRPLWSRIGAGLLGLGSVVFFGLRLAALIARASEPSAGTSQHDGNELWVVSALVLLLLAVVGALLAYQRRGEDRLRRSQVAEVPIFSVARTQAVVLSIGVVTVLMSVYVAMNFGLAHAYPGPTVVLSILTTLIAVSFGVVLGRPLRGVGRLSIDATHITLEYGGTHHRMALYRAFAIEEGVSVMPPSARVQVVELEQDGERWGFSYGLPVWRAHRGSGSYRAPVGPVLDGEAVVIHERLVAACQAAPGVQPKVRQ